MEVVREHLTSAIDAIVHVERQADGSRCIVAVAEVAGHERVRMLGDASGVLATMGRPARLACR